MSELIRCLKLIFLFFYYFHKVLMNCVFGKLLFPIKAIHLHKINLSILLLTGLSIILWKLHKTKTWAEKLPSLQSHSAFSSLLPECFSSWSSWFALLLASFATTFARYCLQSLSLLQLSNPSSCSTTQTSLSRWKMSALLAAQLCALFPLRFFILLQVLHCTCLPWRVAFSFIQVQGVWLK